jgi:beta-1,4-mannosyl-glycoprotein beta-1,4-N-acetylglucosaminyltransferase
LEIRFNELNDCVDKFVIVESVETFTGHPKPMYFDKNKERFQQFWDKIVYVPLFERQNTPSAWDREQYQRNQILRGLQSCDETDLIMISDVDEIPRKSSIRGIAQKVKEKALPVVCEQNLYRFFLNYYDYKISPWLGTLATYYTTLKSKSPHQLRLERINFSTIRNSGWHFSSLGGLEKWIEKIESFSHTEVNLPEHKNTQYIRSYLFQNCKLVPLDETFPEFVKCNLDHFKDIGLIEPSIEE